MIGLGADRLDLVPLDTEGNRPADHQGIEGHVVGTHGGSYAGLNLENPQPGFSYQWFINPSRGGRYDQTAAHQIHRSGGSIVMDADPERAVYRHTANEMSPASQDSMTVYNEVCLVRIPEAKLRDRRNEEEVENLKRLQRGPEAAFVGKSSQIEDNYTSRGPTRYRLASHHSELQQDGRAEVIITPDSSVIHTEDVAR